MSLNDSHQPFAVDLCRKWLARKTTHPLLFYGPAHGGKKNLALGVAMTLNCASGKSDPCGTCSACKRIICQTHPDVRVIDLAWQAAERKEPIEKQQSLRIETITNERHRLLQTAVEGGWKVSIVVDAHRMTNDAANVLLKILEEPPANTAIILITPFKDRMLATIVSRCQPVRFRGPSQAPSLTHAEVEAHRQAETLWESVKTTAPARLVQAAEGRTRTMKMGRAEIEEQIERLLVPAARALRSGDTAAQAPTRLLQEAKRQLRHNVQPGLVYDNLLVQLASLAQTRRPA